MVYAARNPFEPEFDFIAASCSLCECSQPSSITLTIEGLDDLFQLDADEFRVWSDEPPL